MSKIISYIIGTLIFGLANMSYAAVLNSIGLDINGGDNNGNFQDVLHAESINNGTFVQQGTTYITTGIGIGDIPSGTIRASAGVDIQELNPLNPLGVAQSIIGVGSVMDAVDTSPTGANSEITVSTSVSGLIDGESIYSDFYSTGSRLRFAQGLQLFDSAGDSLWTMSTRYDYEYTPTGWQWNPGDFEFGPHWSQASGFSVEWLDGDTQAIEFDVTTGIREWSGWLDLSDVANARLTLSLDLFAISETMINLDFSHTLQTSISATNVLLGGGDGVIYGSQAAVVPVPAAAWLFGSGLLGLIGLARRKKAA